MKKLNDKQKKVLNIVITSLQIAIVLLAIILSAIIIANPNVGNAEVGKANTKLLPVLTNSMKGDKKDSFNKGDLIIAKKPKDADSLKVGDIVTYKMTIGGTNQLNTHRIVTKGTDGVGNVFFYTRGDNNTTNDLRTVYASDVLAVYKYHIKGVGSAINWLQKPTNFLLVIVLPLILLFVYNIILFVKMFMQAKLSKVQEEKDALIVDEEEIKRKAVEEYLATKKAAEEKAKDEPIVVAPEVKPVAKKAPAKAPAKKAPAKKE